MPRQASDVAKARSSPFASTIIVLATLIGAPCAVAASPEQPLIANVRVARAFFNPTLSQIEEISFSLAETAELSIRVLDSSGVTARDLVSKRPSPAGPNSFTWDGRSNEGAVTPNGSYSLQIDARSPTRQETYFPARVSPRRLAVSPSSFNRRGATISYRLPETARVTIEASAAWDIRGSKAGSRVWKTIARDAPRVEGAVVEHWTGFDESDRVYVPDYPRFSLRISAVSLPANSMIVVGGAESPPPRRIATDAGGMPTSRPSQNTRLEK